MRIQRMNPARYALLAGLLGLGACDYDGDFLFADVEAVPAVKHISGSEADGGHLVPIDGTADEIRANTIYFEVGAPVSGSKGGATFTFLGTGGDVCVWVDPELAHWNAKIGNQGAPTEEEYRIPDNLFDDGDVDLYVGLSVYYTGSFGETMGDFYVMHEDSLGNKVPIELVACSNRGYNNIANAHAGRGAPEYCTVGSTSPGVSYTAALHTFSTPLDDDRLAMGVVVYDGSCNALRNVMNSSGLHAEECVIKGEAIKPDGEDAGPWLGFEEAESRAWDGSVGFEEAFCNANMKAFCEAEQEAVAEAGETCAWNDAGHSGEGVRCYCGDPTVLPKPAGG